MPLAAAGRLLANLISLGHNFAGVDGPQANFGSGEYLAASVHSMSADVMAAGLSGLAVAAPRIDSMSLTRRVADSSRLSPILWTLSVVQVLELLTGFGPPDAGEDLQAGSQQFTALAEQLKKTRPDGSWQGSGSAGYGDSNTSLTGLAHQLADLDSQLADIVKDQAEWVTHIRLGFGLLKDLLVAAFINELRMKFTIWPDGPELAYAFAIKVSILGIVIATGMLVVLEVAADANGKKMDAVTTQYDQVAANAVQKDATVAQPHMVAAAQSAVSSFEGATHGDGTTAEVTPSTIPTLAQVIRWSGQDADVSEPAAQQMNLANEITAQIRQRIPMAGSAAGPAEVEGAGTGGDSESAERAPIGGAAAASDGRESPGR